MEFSTTQNTVVVYWDPIECIERNGIITDYIVEFQQEEDGASISGYLVDRSFTAIELSPATLYTFRVAGVNIKGTGPYSDTIYITTEEGGMYESNNSPFLHNGCHRVITHQCRHLNCNKHEVIAS